MKDKLLEKADDNIKTGNFAEKNKYYDAAVSRYYYAIFEKIIYISKKNGFYSNTISGKDSHNDTIINFNSNISNKLETDDITKLTSLLKLKKLRVEADYDGNRINDNNTFNLMFKFYFNEINGVLDKLI